MNQTDIVDPNKLVKEYLQPDDDILLKADLKETQHKIKFTPSEWKTNICLHLVVVGHETCPFT